MVIENQHTDGDEFLLPDGREYIGVYHVRENGITVTGANKSMSGEILSPKKDTKFIKLNKSLYEDKELKNIINTEFNELFQDTNNISLQDFFEYYNNLFFDIPLRGDKSHQSLVNQSLDYIGENPFEKREQQLLDEIAELEAKIEDLESESNEHPIFPDGSILGDNQWEGPVYIMDGGVKRPMENGEVWNAILAAKYPGSGADTTYLRGEDEIRLPIKILQQIETGPLYTLNEFSGKNKQNSSPLSKQLESIVKDNTKKLNKTEPRESIGLEGGIEKENKFVGVDKRILDKQVEIANTEKINIGRDLGPLE